jgi:hypothetical protein
MRSSDTLLITRLDRLADPSDLLNIVDTVTKAGAAFPIAWRRVGGHQSPLGASTLYTTIDRMKYANHVDRDASAAVSVFRPFCDMFHP